MQASRPTEPNNPSQEHSGAVGPLTATAPAQGEEKVAIQTSSRTDGPYTSKPPLGAEPPGPSSASSSGPSQASSSTPRLSAGPEKLKFILGASEDNSSDDEPLIMLPPPAAKASSNDVPQAPSSSASSEPPSQRVPKPVAAPSSSSMR